jgi:nicotinamide mononucleotide transporter
MITLWGYNLSYIEAVAVLSSIACIWLAAKEKIVNFAFGLVCTGLYAVFFYQEHLYSSMTLNIVFFCFNIYGYFLWTRPKKGEENENNELRVRRSSRQMQAVLLAVIAIGTIAWGLAIVHLHEWTPAVFEQATRFPYIDSFVMVASIVAQLLMAQKKLENWILWIVIDVVATFLYAFAGYTFTAILYAILVIIAIKGLYDWQKSYKNKHTNTLIYKEQN